MRLVDMRGLLKQTRDVKKIISNTLFMLRKIRKYMTLDSAISIYIQTILTIFVYPVFFLLMSLCI